ncbi:MAG: S8 family serine peptidase, partial [Cytophagales bacterium]|nr:S8 family serine peptidase [Cytophagales bacterium]
MQRIISCLTLAAVFVVFSSQAQTKYWIGFKDKSNLMEMATPAISKKTIRQRLMLGLSTYQYTDLPVSPAYLDRLNQMEVPYLVASRWLNAVSAYLTPEQLEKVGKLDFVEEIVPVKHYLVPTKYQSDELITAALADLGAEVFVSKGIDASGVVIGVIDAGFYDADREEGVSHLFLSEKVLGTRDYLDTLRPISYSKKVSELDDHGTEVLKCLGGFDISANLKYGLATGANFYLARTDHGKFENRAEEDKWIAAMEWMDSLGVRLVNSSLGYSTGFDLLEENYKPHQMDGKTSKISRAAQIATEEKGMIVVVSAGNEGDKPNWLVLTAPADAQGVIAVGAVKSEQWEKVSHSSVGPEWLPYLKPDVSAFSLRGTSFSAPLV